MTIEKLLGWVDFDINEAYEAMRKDMKLEEQI